MRMVLRFEGLVGCEVLVLGYVVVEVGHFGCCCGYDRLSRSLLAGSSVVIQGQDAVVVM